MGGLANFFASTLIVHTGAESLFKFHGLVITNSIFYGWICAILMIIFLIVISRLITVKPKGGLIQYIELGVTFMTDTVISSFLDKERGRKYIPYFTTLFFFILINNWSGLIPGVGQAIVYNGTPLLRPFTGDLNATLAAGVITMLYVYYFSVKETGFKEYFKHFFVGSIWNPLFLFVGLLEIILDLTRVISLSLRLFLNIMIGEIVIAVFAYLGGFLAPVTAAPFYGVEIGVGALQAYIFALLSVNYLAIAVNHSTELEDLTDEMVPETMSLQTE